MTRSGDRRVWARLTVDFADSPKVAGLSDAAFRTLVEMILWSRKVMTDGVIPASVAHRRWGAKTRTETHSVTESATDSGTQTKPRPKAETETELEDEVLRTSSLSPATPESARATTSKPRKRHKPTTPIPDDWAPTPEHRSRAAAAGVDVDHEAEMFRAHAEANDRWQASWNAAFTTWLGKSAQRAAEQRSRQGYRNQAQIMQDVHRQAQEATIAMRRQQGSALQLIAGEAS